MKHALLLAGLITCTSAVADGTPDWLDNFNDGSVHDGSPVLWESSPAFGSAYEVIDGDLYVSIPETGWPPISSPRVSVNFENGASVRARMVALNGPGRFTVAFADQPTGIQGYVASFSTCNGGTLELFRGDVLGEITFLGGTPIPWTFSPLEEFIIQLDVFDGVVAARVWRPGEPFPTEPHAFEADDHYSAGVASIAIQDFGSGNCVSSGNFRDAFAIVRYAQASSTPLQHADTGDLNADGVVGVEDLLQLLGEWGPCDGFCPPACAADIHPLGGDCTVNTDDLLALLANWG